MTFSMEDIEKRAPVWEALSELFVGKELQVYDYEFIAKRLLESAYGVDDLEVILTNEVTPVCRGNLSPFLTVPEMEGWNKDAIAADILRHLRDRKRWQTMLPPWLQWHRRLPSIAHERWQKVKSYLNG